MITKKLSIILDTRIACNKLYFIVESFLYGPQTKCIKGVQHLMWRGLSITAA